MKFYFLNLSSIRQNTYIKPDVIPAKYNGYTAILIFSISLGNLLQFAITAIDYFALAILAIKETLNIVTGHLETNKMAKAFPSRYYELS